MRVEKHWGFKRIMNMFSNKWAHLKRELITAIVKIAQTV